MMTMESLRKANGRKSDVRKYQARKEGRWSTSLSNLIQGRKTRIHIKTIVVCYSAWSWQVVADHLSGFSSDSAALFQSYFSFDFFGRKSRGTVIRVVPQSRCYTNSRCLRFSRWRLCPPQARHECVSIPSKLTVNFLKHTVEKLE